MGVSKNKLLRWIPSQYFSSAHDIYGLGYFWFIISAGHGTGAVIKSNDSVDFERFLKFLPPAVMFEEQIDLNQPIKSATDWDHKFLNSTPPDVGFPCNRLLLHSNENDDDLSRCDYEWPCLDRAEAVEVILCYAEKIGISESQLNDILSDPVETIRFGYHLAKKVGFLKLLQPYERFSGLSIDEPMFAVSFFAVGLGVLFLYPYLNCKFCFRRAVPGHLFCAGHSQSKKNLGQSDRHTNRNRAKAAKKIASTIEISDFSHKRDIEIEQGLAAIIWDSHPCDENLLNDAIMTAVLATKAVQKLLPKNFVSLSVKLKLERLKSVLDPHEWLVGNWPEKILEAEKWFIEEAKVKRRISPKTIRRLRESKRLHSVGWAFKDIAVHLGIKPSYLSKLRSRYGDAV